MWVRNHQGGNDLVCSVFPDPPWSFHKSALSGALPGHGVIALFVLQIPGYDSQNRLSMSLFMFLGIFLTRAVPILRQSYFSLTFSPVSACCLTPMHSCFCDVGDSACFVLGRKPGCPVLRQLQATMNHLSCRTSSSALREVKSRGL